MIAADPFQYDRYSDFLKGVIAQNRGSRGTQTELAKAAGCHKSYFSQVLSGRAEFTPEHALGISRHLALSADAESYVLNLLLKDRAGTKALRDYYDSRLKTLLAKRANLSRRFKDRSIEDEERKRAVYYSSPYYALIHMAIRIKALQSEEALLEKFRIRKRTLKKILKDLSDLGLIQIAAGAITPGPSSLHLPRDASQTIQHHSHWRMKAIQEMGDPDDASIHYSSVYSLSKADLKILQEKIIRFLEETRKSVIASKSDEVLAIFCCDLFPG